MATELYTAFRWHGLSDSSPNGFKDVLTLLAGADQVLRCRCPLVLGLSTSLLACAGTERDIGEEAA